MKSWANKFLVWLGVREQRVEHILSDFTKAIAKLDRLADDAAGKAEAKRQDMLFEAADHEATIRALQAERAARDAAAASAIADLNDQAKRATVVAGKIASLVSA